MPLFFLWTHINVKDAQKITVSCVISPTEFELIRFTAKKYKYNYVKMSWSWVEIAATNGHSFLFISNQSIK